ncbi:hypothetical protein [Burkholderia cenocepacia]|uniref:hypothetical protein n=1 Tax=Burkholderia cenocepacia TaxID=95486 RepID=UPI00076101AE|nr:hypothetical protein [Burkholderia cenocepacia]KWU24726.1 hypothetical protein AS149_31770 [Burkholderia cenocepacia]
MQFENSRDFEISMQLQTLVGSCKLLDRVDNGQLPLPPSQYVTLGCAARESMHALLKRDVADLTEAVARLAGFSNAAHELFESEWISQMLIEAPHRLPELTQVLAKARAKASPCAPATTANTLTLICQQADGRDNLHVTGLSSLDADSRRILEAMTSVVAQPTATADGFELRLSAGSAKPLAQMMASTLTLRKVAVRVA